MLLWIELNSQAFAALPVRSVGHYSMHSSCRNVPPRWGKLGQKDSWTDPLEGTNHPSPCLLPVPLLLQSTALRLLRTSWSWGRGSWTMAASGRSGSGASSEQLRWAAASLLLQL